MGTTVVGILITNDLASVASVGDSRAYLYRENQMKILTRDDIWLNETWVRRAFTEDQLQKIPLKNILSKAIGSKEDIDFPLQELQLKPDDLIVLCSDGLHGLVVEEDLLVAARESKDLETMCRTMIRLANEAGGKDNITVIALRYSS